MKTQEALFEKVKSFPSQPGVYTFLDGKSKVLYVGKAKNLRKRVTIYFKEGGDGRPQIPKLMSLAKGVQFLVTKTEKEALFLENNLIKQNYPPFNICLKDDKTFKSIVIKAKHPFPGIGIVRKYTPERGEYLLWPFFGGRKGGGCFSAADENLSAKRLQ